MGPTDIVATYIWDGRLQDAAEILLIIKTTAARLKVLQPYELPERVALPATGGNEQYLEWVRSGVAVTQRTETT